MTGAPTIQSESAGESAAVPRWRIYTARALIVVATLLAAVSILAGYVRYQALDTSTVEDTAAELIADDAVRNEIAADLVDQLYANVDVASALRTRLPANQRPLAAPIAGALRELTDRAAVRILGRPRVQALWVQSVGQAHRQLLRLLDDRGTVIRTSGGDVVLDLRPLVVLLGNQVAIVGNLGDRLPADAGQIVLMKSDDLRSAQRGVHLLDILGRFLWIVTLGLVALAVWLARGQRRATLKAFAIGLIVAGLLVLVLRRVLGGYVVDALIPPGTETTPADHAWTILTSLLVDGGRTVVLVGVIALVGLWLAGDTHSAVSARRELAPPLARWEIAYGAAFVFLLLLVWWGPTAQLHRANVVILFAVLLALGVWALRRLTLQEHPNAGELPAGTPLRRAWDAVRSNSTPPSQQPH